MKPNKTKPNQTQTKQNVKQVTYTIYNSIKINHSYTAGSLKGPLFRSHPIIEIFYCNKENRAYFILRNGTLWDETKRNEICTWHWKVHKSRQHGVHAIVWVAWAYEEKFSVRRFPSVFVERSYWQGGDRQSLVSFYLVSFGWFCFGWFRFVWFCLVSFWLVLF